MSPTRLFVCGECGQEFEVSTVVARSRVNMTLCPNCGGHEIVLVRESSRESSPPPSQSGEDAA
jgi:DNA-directed RNA polymerase subunit RPC12/RpoP